MMKNRLFNMCRSAIGYVRRRRLDALRRRTGTNGLWQITECPDFLSPDRERPTEAGQERGPDPADDTAGFGAADRIPGIVRDGVRIVFWGIRIVSSRPPAKRP